MIKTFKGLMSGDTSIENINVIRLSTNNGLTGYKMKKFQVIPNVPGAESTEAVVKVYTVPQTTSDGTINFDDPTLIATAFFRSNASAAFATDVVIVLDTVVFNQDIYVTCHDLEGNAMNYMITLEQVKLDTSEATVATLKDMRGRE